MKQLQLFLSLSFGVMILATSAIAQPLAQSLPSPANFPKTLTMENEQRQAPQSNDQRINNLPTEKVPVESRPIPFTDVSPDHWAFEALMNLYY